MWFSQTIFFFFFEFRLELSEVELEVGKFSVLRQEVQEEERVFKVFKAQNAVKRLQQEKNNSHTLQRKIQHLKKLESFFHFGLIDLSAVYLYAYRL